MPGIGYITLMEDGSFKGPIDKFLTDEDRKNLIKSRFKRKWCSYFFIADKKRK